MTLQYLDVAIGIGVIMLAVSLLITILVQLVANMLSLRGSNLRWALTTLIAEIHPDLKDRAKDIAQQVLTHPLISDSTVSNFSKTPVLKYFIQRISLANAVRLEELVGVLDLLGDSTQATTTSKGAMAALAAAAKSKMGPQVQSVSTQAAELVGELNKAAAPAGWMGTINVDQLLGKVPGAAETVFGKDIKSWFNSTMDRAAQRFTLHMRIVTIALAVLVAYGIHLDSIKLFSDLSASPEMRASLVDQAGSMERLAGDILSNQKKSPADTPAPAASTATSAAVPACTAEHVPAVYAQAVRALQRGKTDPKDPDTALMSTVVATLPAQTFANRKNAADWLQSSVIGATNATDGKASGARLVAEYQSKVDCMLQTDTDKLLDRAAQVHSTLGDSQFRLIPDPYPPLNPLAWRHREQLGILFSAGLLGLGAPFWFNALKSMTALRPILANKQEKESKSTAS